jgi:protein O-mannosyl-transferase
MAELPEAGYKAVGSNGDSVAPFYFAHAPGSILATFRSVLNNSMSRISASPSFEPRSLDGRSHHRRKLILSMLLSAITLLLYSRVSSAGFINFDDPQYVVHNSHVVQGMTWETIKWSFISYEAGNWHPLTWLSHALDWQLFQGNPGGHHYVNLLFHATNAVLLFLVLLSATRGKWVSWMVAAVWAFHPVNVESVAWIAERKNVLSMFFFLLALYAYGKFVQKQNIGRYLVVAFLFALGLMAKPQVITFPLLLILWDYWPLKRFNPLGWGRFESPSLLWLTAEKLPLLILSAASAWVTMQAQRLGEAVRTAAEFSVSARIENAVTSYIRYVGNAVWPSRLSPIYPHPENSIPVWQFAAAAAFLLIVTGLVVWQRQRRYLLVGWFWFLGSLVPMIGLVQVGQQAMADRYAYLPFIGLFLAVVWGAAEFLERWNVSPAVAVGASVVLLIVLGAATSRQVGYWRNSETLWTRALAVTEKNYTAHGNLGDALARTGRSDEAIEHFEAAERLHRYPPSQVLALGVYEQQHGHVETAIEQFKQVSQASDTVLRGAALVNLGSAYLQIGKRSLARESYAEALQTNPSDSGALVGNGLMAYDDNPELAATLFSRAVAVQPTDARLLLLAAALRNAGHPVEANAAYERSRRISPNFAKAQASADQLLGIWRDVSK